MKRTNYTRADLRYFAFVFRDSDGVLTGCVIDYYPDERADHIKDDCEAIIGDFATREEAQALVDQRFARETELHQLTK